MTTKAPGGPSCEPAIQTPRYGSGWKRWPPTETSAREGAALASPPPLAKMTMTCMNGTYQPEGPHQGQGNPPKTDWQLCSRRGK